MVPNPSGPSSTGEGTSNTALDEAATLLDDVMKAPSTKVPDVVVLDTTYEKKDSKESLDLKKDLWLSSADGRYNSPIIPLRVGTAPHSQTFYVHKSILIKAEYFRKAICGEFKESEAQAIDLPEEDPAIFHFIVAFLYEAKYIPIRPAAAALAPDTKGKGVEDAEDGSNTSDSDSSVELLSDSSAVMSRRRRERRRRHEDRHWERMRQKHPGVHRLGCGCRQCVVGGGPPCWNCAAPRLPPPPGPPPPPPPPGAGYIPERPRARHTRRRADRRRPVSPPIQPTNNEAYTGDRISGQDLRTWLLTYELNIDVYICANKFLLDDFKVAIARVCIDMLETAGADAAQSEVLQLCYKLYQGLPESDNLLKMVFARMGFLQSHLFRKMPHETLEFLHTHPEVSALILKEMGTRREEDHGVHNLPAMERPDFPPILDSYGRPTPIPRPIRW